jgi:hypothetical protein
MHMPLLSLSAAALLLAGTVVGCGGDNSGDVAVQGSLAYQGKPVPDAKLDFFSSSGRPLTTQVSADGEYNIELSPGEYRVVVTQGVTLPPGYKEGDPLPPPPVKLPPKYTKRVETPLTASVSADNSSQTIDFNLD